MKTNMGRVVYDREKHFMDEKAIYRIIKSNMSEKTFAEQSKFYADLLVRFIFEEDFDMQKIAVFNAYLIVAQVKYMGISVIELWNKIKEIVGIP